MRDLTNTILAASVAVVGAAVAACGGSSSSPSVVAPATTVTVENFAGTVNPGGLKIHSFTVNAPGTISVTMTSAGPPATITMGLGLGNPDASGNCIFLSGATAQAIASTTTPQLSGSLTSSGAYCVEIVDLGNAAGPITYTITVSHT
jgi:hypothetical protein